MADHRRRFNRRTLLIGSGAALVAVPTIGAIDGLLITPRRLVTTTHPVGNVPGNPPTAGNPVLRLAQVTDLHMTALTQLYQTLIERLHACEPDLIVLTGDMIERPECLAALDAFLGELPDRPTFAVLGNWEYWSGVPQENYRRLYEKHTIELLVNQSSEISKDGRTLRLTGLDDLVAGRPDPAAAVAGVPPAANHLLLAHCPAARDACRLPETHPTGLVLSGHTHGGQIAPFGRALVLPHGSGRYVSGWYRDGGPPLYVSRGIGTSMMPVRVGSTPELAVFDWALA